LRQHLQIRTKVGIERALARKDFLSRREEVPQPNLQGVKSEQVGSFIHLQLASEAALRSAKAPQ